MGKYCVYRFLDESGTVIYIGSTEDFNKRMKGHTHLPKECYDRTKSVEACFFESESNMYIYEVYLINKYLPEFNRNMRGTGTNIKLYEPKWKACGNPFKDKHNKAVTGKKTANKGYVVYFPNGLGVVLKHKYEVVERLKQWFSQSDIYRMFKGEEIAGYSIKQIK